MPNTARNSGAKLARIFVSLPDLALELSEQRQVGESADKLSKYISGMKINQAKLETILKELIIQINCSP